MWHAVKSVLVISPFEMGAIGDSILAYFWGGSLLFESLLLLLLVLGDSRKGLFATGRVLRGRFLRAGVLMMGVGESHFDEFDKTDIF